MTLKEADMYPHRIDEQTEVEKLSNLPQFTPSGNKRVSMGLPKERPETVRKGEH